MFTYEEWAIRLKLGRVACHAKQWPTPHKYWSGWKRWGRGVCLTGVETQIQPYSKPTR